MKPLTERQLEVLLFVQLSQRIHGVSPSVREVAEHLGIRSTNAANEHLQALATKGYIEQGKHGAARSLRGLVKVDATGKPIDIQAKVDRVKQMFRDRCGRWPQAERAVDELVEALS